DQGVEREGEVVGEHRGPVVRGGDGLRRGGPEVSDHGHTRDRESDRLQGQGRADLQPANRPADQLLFIQTLIAATITKRPMKTALMRRRPASSPLRRRYPPPESPPPPMTPPRPVAFGVWSKMPRTTRIASTTCAPMRTFFSTQTRLRVGSAASIRLGRDRSPRAKSDQLDILSGH